MAQGSRAWRRWRPVAVGAAALAGAMIAAAGAAASRASAPGTFSVPVPAPGHVELAVVSVNGGARFAKGAVPRPELVNPAALPKGVLAVGDVGRSKQHPSVLVAGVLLVNLNKRAARTPAGTADFNIATGLKWVPLRYTHPIGPVATSDCSGDASQIVCTGSNPGVSAPLYGWQTTSLDNYIGFFFHPQVGMILSLDLGYGSHHTAADDIGAAHATSKAYFQFGLAQGGKFYLNPPKSQGAAPNPSVDVFEFFTDLNAVTQPPAPPAPAPSPTPFTLGFSTWWDHVQPGVMSNACAMVTTTPAEAGAAGQVTIAGPGVIGPMMQSFTLGQNGTGTLLFPINQFGDYTFSFTVTANGVTETGTTTDHVTSSPGTAACK